MVGDSGARVVKDQEIVKLTCKYPEVDILKKCIILNYLFDKKKENTTSMKV